ncbi:hypothetical protein P885DRAFT_44305 [Corynascus similis CBS 632.67]
MKFTAAALALAASAIAAPSQRDNTCKFGTYRCTTPNTGIEICNISSQWELVGPCPKGTSCNDLQNGNSTLPYCTNDPPAVEARNGRPSQSPGEACQTAGRYDCFGPYAIQVCDAQNISQFVGNCPPKSHCAYINDIPYCVESV